MVYSLKDWRYDITPLHDRFLRETCGKIKGKTLDIGCGPGYSLKYFDAGSVGVDMNPVHNPTVVAYVTELPFKDGTFDNVYCSHVIEHNNTREGVMMLKEFERVLKKGGRLYLMTPNIHADWKTFYDEFTHEKEYTKYSLANIVKCNTSIKVESCRSGTCFLALNTGFGGLSRIIPQLTGLLLILNNIIVRVHRRGLMLIGVKE